MRGAALPALLAAALAAAAAPAPAAEEAPSFAVRGVRLLPGDGTEVPDGVVVVRAGRVEAAGPAATTPLPPGLEVVEGAGGTLAPSLILPATRLGLPGESGARDRGTPTESVLEELPPSLPLHRIAAAAGVSLVGLLPGPGAPGGEGAAVRCASVAGGDFLVEGARLLRVDVDPTTGWARGLAGALEKAKKEVEAEDRHEKEMEAFRAASAEFEAGKAAAEARFKEATERFEREKAAAEKEGKPAPKAPEKEDPGKPPAEPKAVKNDPRTAVLRDALRRRVATVVVCGSAADADRALDVLAPFRLRLCFLASGDAWRVAPRMAGAGASVVLEPRLQNAPGSLDLVNPAAVFEAVGCPVAFAPDAASRQGLDALRVQVGLLARDGLPRAAALRGLSLEGARILGVEGSTGSLAPGREADMVLYDGDPLEGATRLRAAWSRGVPVPLSAGGGERP